MVKCFSGLPHPDNHTVPTTFQTGGSDFWKVLITDFCLNQVRLLTSCPVLHLLDLHELVLLCCKLQCDRDLDLERDLLLRKKHCTKNEICGWKHIPGCCFGNHPGMKMLWVSLLTLTGIVSLIYWTQQCTGLGFRVGLTFLPDNNCIELPKNNWTTETNTQKMPISFLITERKCCTKKHFPKGPYPDK